MCPVALDEPSGPLHGDSEAGPERDPPRIASAIVELVYGDLAALPRRVGKPLRRELAGLFSAWRGPYRILYDIDDATETIRILAVDHRGDVYRPA